MNVLFLLFLSLFLPLHAAVSLEPQNNRMVKNMIQDVHKKYQVPKAWLESQFSELRMNESVLNLMQKPFEAKPWSQYKKMMLSHKRIENGKKFIKKNQSLLSSYEKRFQIPASVVVSIIGIETSYGQNKGNFNVLEALSTLAFYYSPRCDYFYDEAVSLLRYAYKNKLSTKHIKSSYAGAIGIPQFMPSNIEKYGLHHSSKGQVDIYDNTDDAIASVFNYLHRNGKWQPKQPVMRKLSLSAEKNKHLQNIFENKRMIAVNPSIEKQFNLRKAPKSWIIKLQKTDGDFEYYRVFHNFKAIMRYNNSVHYSTAVFSLSQKLQQ